MSEFNASKTKQRKLSELTRIENFCFRHVRFGFAISMRNPVEAFQGIVQNSAATQNWR